MSLSLWDLTWSFRRAIGGALAGGAGWIVSLALFRLSLPGADIAAPHPVFHMLAGVFLGVAGGLMEQSSSLTWRGLFTGGAGGFAAGLALRAAARGATEGLMFYHAALWTALGLVLGLSGRLKAWEAAGGALGGAVAGCLAWSFSMTMAVENASPAWAQARGIEFLTGAIVGALLWGGLALGSRLGLRFSGRTAS